MPLTSYDWSYFIYVADRCLLSSQKAHVSEQANAPEPAGKNTEFISPFHGTMSKFSFPGGYNILLVYG